MAFTEKLNFTQSFEIDKIKQKAFNKHNAR